MTAPGTVFPPSDGLSNLLDAVSRAADRAAENDLPALSNLLRVLCAEIERLSPKFDAMAPEQERLAIEFCMEIAGRKGEKPNPPDPVRLLEMAEALYRAEVGR